MADELKPDPKRTPGIERQPAPPGMVLPPAAPEAGSLSGRSERLLVVLIALLAALSLWLGWRAFYYQEEGDPVGSAMLAFEKQNSLVVFASRFEVVADATYEQTVGPITVRRVRQATIIPATVEYRLDLSGMDRDAFLWNEETQTLGVTLPQLQTSRPNLDESKARVFTEGLLNTGGSQQALTKESARIAEKKAGTVARNPEVLSLARIAAKEAVRQNLAVPLQVAGYEAATVEVQFAGE